MILVISVYQAKSKLSGHFSVDWKFKSDRQILTFQHCECDNDKRI